MYYISFSVATVRLLSTYTFSLYIIVMLAFVYVVALIHGSCDLLPIGPKIEELFPLPGMKSYCCQMLIYQIQNRPANLGLVRELSLFRGFPRSLYSIRSPDAPKMFFKLSG